MKSSVLTHLIWLVVAGAAFAIGWMARPSGSDADTATADAGGGRTTLATRDPDGGSKAGEKPGFVHEPAVDISRYFDGNGVITGKSMGQAMRDALNESDPLKSNLLFAQLLEELSADNVEEALAALEEAPQGWETWQKMGLFVGVWGRVDGPAALEYAQKLPGPGRMFGPAAALSGWATTDSDAAIKWLESSDMDARLKTAGAAGILRGLAISNPEKATAYLQSLPEDTQGLEQLVDVLANEQMKKGVADATQWAEGLGTDKLKEKAFDQLSAEYSRRDPVEASTWVGQYADKGYAAGAVKEVADEWAEIDPRSAVGWASKLPDATQSGAMEAAFKEWTQANPKEASEYLYTMDASPARDSAVAGFVSDLGREDPESAITWAKTIDNEQVRMDALQDVATDWYGTDKEAASAWLPESGLPPETVEKITTPQNNMTEMWQRLRDGAGFP